MPQKILVTGDFVSDRFLNDLRSNGYEVKNVVADLDEDALIREVENADAYILGGVETVSGRVIKATKHLKIIAFVGVGYERFIPGIEEATNRGILVTNTPGANTQTAAEMTWSLLFALLRGIPHLNALTKKGEWGTYKSRELQGRTLGIVGMGAMGMKVARQAHNGFDMKVIYYSRTPKPLIESAVAAEFVSLNDLLKRSDVVSLHCTYTQDTHGLIGSKELSLMKEDALLINVARPEIVDPKALAACLSKRSITGSAMDGYYIEPAPAPDKDPYGLLSLPDDVFIVTPHTGGQTYEASNRMSDFAVASVVSALEGRPVPRVVNLGNATHKK